MIAMAEISRAPRLDLVKWLLPAYVLLFAAYTLLAPNDSPGRMWVMDLGQMVAPLVAMPLCLLASRSSTSRRQRLSWLFFALACASWVIGQTAWSYYELVLDRYVPIDSLVDVPFGAYYPLALAGLMLYLPATRERAGILATAFDALLFTIAVGGLTWHFALAPSLADVENPVMAAIMVGSPIGDLVLIFATVSRVLQLPMERVPRSSFYLLGGLICQILVDTLLSCHLLLGEYHTGSPIDALWQLSYTLIGFGALASVRATSGGNEVGGWRDTINVGWTRGLQMSLPYFSLPAAIVLLYHSFNPDPGESSASILVALAIAVVLVALVMLRQLLTLVENQRLSISLTALSRDLESRVERRTMELTRRTNELAALNHAATRLSHCRSLDDVVSAGVDLLSDATQSMGGVVWLVKADGQFDVVGHRGLPPETVAALSDHPDRSLGFRRILEYINPGVLSGSGLPPALQKQPTRKLVVIPLPSRGSVLGAVGVLRAGDDSVEESTLQLARAIGAQLGVAIESARRYEDTRYLAERDPVTGLFNHRAIHQRLDQELKRAQRSGGEVSLVIMDIDGFKLFNDTYGHPMGDQALKNVANLMRESARAWDILGRYGGDEFVAVLPQTSREGAVAFAQRLRAALSGHPSMVVDNRRVPLRLSFGVGVFPHDARKGDELMGFADSNLYEAKSWGGDTITAGDAVEKEPVKAGNYSVLEGLVTAVDNKDRYTRKHSEDVTVYALALAQSMGLSEETLRTLRIAGLLHDVGKIGVPDRILRKPGRLTDEEFAIVKQHALLGEMIIKEVPNVTDVLAAVGAHHERYDGRGYPRGLGQDEIPLLGRILAVADAYSAMTTDRPYRQAMTAEEARAELLRVAGSQLDPAIVEKFLSMPPTADAQPVTITGSGESTAVAG